MTIQDLHKKALEIVDVAFINNFNGNEDIAIAKFKEALDFEKKAAFLAKQENIGEPSESILFRSAAAIALNAKEFRIAEKLVAFGLSGDPPFEIAEELRNLLEDIHFNRHLNLQGINLDNSEIQMVIAGKGIGLGLVKSEEFIERVSTVQKITLRTVERKLGKPFREKGNFAKEVKDFFQPYISMPRAASFAFTIKLGQPSKQIEIPGTERAIDIIDDIVENLSLINESKEETLKERIRDKTYLRNFIVLSKELAPDGDNISLVGFTIVRNGKEKRIQFTRRRSDFSSSLSEFTQEEQQMDNKIIEVIGRLSAADSEKSNIRITLDNGLKYSVVVPEGLGDIVKNYWDESVKIKGFAIKKRAIKLIDLDPIK